MSKYQIGIRSLHNFIKCQRGVSAVLFAFMAVPLMAISGGLLDYSRAMRVKGELAATLDTAVLAATQAYALDDSIDPQQIIASLVEENYSKSGKNLLSTIPEVSEATISSDGEITANLRAVVSTSFLALIGQSDFEVEVSASAKVGGQQLELALVLDNTGSMQGDKIATLKDAADNMVDTLMGGPQDNVKIAVVPFADYVKIDMDDRHEPGLDVPDDFDYSWTPSGENCWWEYPNSTQQCTPVKGWGTCYNDGQAYDCYKTLSWSCTGDKGEGVKHCQPHTEKTKTYKWHGCMASRAHDMNVVDDNYDTGVPGMMRWCDVAQMTRLSGNKDDVTTAIGKMKAKGRTYIPSGLAWGWRAISPVAPFADGVGYDNDKVKKAIVLMTDGDNTIIRKKLTGAEVSHHAGEVWAHSVKKNVGQAGEADGYTAELCENIKAQGITVHTIAFEVAEGSPVEELMKNCAGNGGQYFDADDSEQLTAAFKQIAIALLKLRLTK